MKKATESVPGNGRIIIKPIPKKQGSLIETGKPDEKPQRGIVVAVGKRKDDRDAFVEIGKEYVYGRYAGILVEFEDGEHIVMFESDVISE